MDDPRQEQNDQPVDQEQAPEEDSMFPMPEMDLELREGLVEDHKESSDE